VANILLVGDNPDWAFGQTIASMKSYYSGPHVLQSAWTVNMEDLARRHQHAHLIVAFCTSIVGKLAKLSVPKDKILVGIRGAGDNSMPSTRMVERLAKTQGVICANQLLYNIWKGNHKHVYLAYEAADLRTWFPQIKRRHARLPLRVGWNGNSSKRYKNYHEIFVPLMNVLEKEGTAQRVVRDRDTNGIPRERMREEFYYQIDVLAMTAFREGNPYPLYEAMACGVPCLSSYAGVAPELITDNEDGWIINNPTIDTFSVRVRQLAYDLSGIQRAGEAARRKIKAAWCWEKQISSWSMIFNEALRRRGHGQQEDFDHL
jgi:glycosyltransferase involved in cell wall biosynthesis